MKRARDVPAIGGGTGGSGGGGGGGGVPTPPATGLLLTSNGSTPGAYDWEPPGGFKITSFGGITQTVRRGATVHNPSWTATFSQTPDAQSLTWTSPTGSEILTPGQASGTITADYTSTTNGAQSVATMHATKGATAGTLSQAITFADSVLDNPNGVDPATIALTQAFMDANLTRESLHTAPAGTYTKTTSGGPNVEVVAVPTALFPGTWKDGNGLLVSPTVYGAVAGWTNADGVVIPMTIISLGAAGAAASYTWSP